MRANLQYDMLLPILIRGTVHLAVPAHARLENARQEEVFEHLVDVAVGACVPSEAIEADGVGGDPAPPRLWPGEGLVSDFQCLPLANGGENRTRSEEHTSKLQSLMR